MAEAQALAKLIQEHFSDKVQEVKITTNEVTVEIPSQHLRDLCTALRDLPEFRFEQLMDLCGVDYSDYGMAQWQTHSTTRTGFERGVDLSRKERLTEWNKPRFAVVSHLLSVTHNHRIRVRAFVEGEPLAIDSVVDIWESANWFEREAFDLFGILFVGHPDLRRLLTDYGFVGYPFRKDFPLIGTVEPRYDATQQRVIYEPVGIAPRTLVPKVIRADSRYLAGEEK